MMERTTYEAGDNHDGAHGVESNVRCVLALRNCWLLICHILSHRSSLGSLMAGSVHFMDTNKTQMDFKSATSAVSVYNKHSSPLHYEPQYP